MKKILYNQQNCCIDTPYGEIAFLLLRKNVKNINMRIRSDLTITISANRKINEKTIYDFAIKNLNWILHTIEKIKLKQKAKQKITSLADQTELYLLGKKYDVHIINSKTDKVFISNKSIQIMQKDILDTQKTQQITAAFLKKTGEKIFNKLCRKWMKLTEFNTPLTFQIRNMTSRWGSCNPTKKKITFNLKLLVFPIQAAEYVVLHEILHFFHKGHDKNFYKALAKFMPDYKEREKILKNQVSVCAE